MAIQYSILSKDQIREKIGLDGIFKISATKIFQTKERLRDELEKDTLTYLNTYNHVLGQVSEVFAKEGKNIANLINSSEAEDRINVREIVNAYNKIDKTLRDGVDQGHIDVGVLSKQLLVLYVRFDERADDARKAGKTRAKVPTTVATLKDGRVKVKNVNKDVVVIERIAEDLRRLYIMSKALDELDNDTVKRLVSKNTEPKEFLREALNNYFDKGQSHHDISKTKTVNIITGEGTQIIKLESRTDNRGKGDVSELIGIGRGEAVTKKLEDEILSSLMQEYGNDFTKITGSKPLETEIVDQIMNVATGKKAKKYRSSSSKRKRVSSPVKTKLSKAVTAAILAQQVAKKGLPRITISPRKDRGESGRGDTRNRDINKLRMKINQRLPAEVRRNMGRPALRNQTGRFSNSVTLTELRQGPKTLVGKYTYMLSPYETFDNEGPRQWPTGYNPKTLITKSIRNLAMQYTEQKFTLRKE